jgi:hypothetical protein
LGVLAPNRVKSHGDSGLDQHSQHPLGTLRARLLRQDGRADSRKSVRSGWNRVIAHSHTLIVYTRTRQDAIHHDAPHIMTRRPHTRNQHIVDDHWFGTYAIMINTA